ncbi:MAG: M20/M25/M40 family metallo-hydrolase [Actinomycetales bacterium]
MTALPGDRPPTKPFRRGGSAAGDAPVGGASLGGPDADVVSAEVRNSAAEHLAALIRCETVSLPGPSADSRSDSPPEDGTGQADQFRALRGLLPRLYPLVFGALEAQDVAGHALLLRWPGSHGTGRPVVLMAHLDVVPAPPEGWTHAPFSGHRADGFIWGRGALDDKGSAVAILEAVELLLAEGFAPSGDVYLSFGDNEETAGHSAAAAAALLASRAVSPWLVLDEGGAVASGAFPGVRRPAAVVGVAEKGILDLQLRTTDPGGHASTPGRMGAPARLARAILRLERHPFPQTLPAPVRDMLAAFAPHATWPLRPVLAHLRPLRWPLLKAFARFGGETNAMTRTTVAITTLQGSPGANVLAATATANANIRIMVGESVAGTLKRVRRIIRDPRVELTLVQGSEPSPVSPTDNEQFALLESVIGTVFPDAFTAPYLMMGGTDSRRFTSIATAVCRFSPFRMSAADRASIHGVDEKISLDTLAEGIRFYRLLVRSLS